MGDALPTNHSLALQLGLFPHRLGTSNLPTKAGMPGWSGAGRFARAYGALRDGGGIHDETDAIHECCSRAWPENDHPGVAAGLGSPIEKS